MRVFKYISTKTSYVLDPPANLLSKPPATFAADVIHEVIIEVPFSSFVSELWQRRDKMESVIFP